MRIYFSCAECGKNRFSLTDAESDACMVRGEDCGHDVGTLAELKRYFSAAVTQQAATRRPDLAS